MANELKIPVSLEYKKALDSAKRDLKQFSQELGQYSKDEISQIQSNVASKVTANSKGAVNELTRLRKEVNSAKSDVAGAFLQGKPIDEFSAKLRTAQGNLQSVNKAVKDAGISAKMSRAQWLEFGENVTTITAGVVLLGKAIYDTTKQSIMQGAQLKVLKDNYKGTAEDLALLTKATAGTLTEAQLIPIYNKATEQMKLTTEQTARLLAYSEDLADKGIGTLTDNFNSLTTAILTGGRGLRTLGIDQKQFKEDLKNTATQLGINTGLIEDGNEEDSISIEKLDAKTQRILILKTLFDGGYIPSLQNVIDKTADSADKLEAINVKLQEAKTEAGLFILNGAEPLIDSFLGMSKSSTIAAGSITAIGTVTASVLPLIANLKIAFSGAGLAAMGLYGAAALAGAALGTLLAKIEDEYDIVDRINRMYGLAPKKLTINDYLQNFPKGNIQEQLPYGPELPPDFKKKTDVNLSKGLKNTGGKKDTEETILNLDKVLSLLGEQIKANEDLFKLGDINAKQLDEAYIKAYDILKSNEKLVDVTKKNISEEERLLEIQANRVKFRQQEVELQNKSFSNTAQEIKNRVFNNILQSGLKPKYTVNNGLPNAGLDINDTRKLREQVEVSILDAQLNKGKKDPMEGFNKLAQDSSALVSDVSNVMSILGMGTDSWAGQVLGTFDSVISLLSSIGGIAQKLGQGDFVGAIFSGIGSLFGGRSGGDSVGRGNNLSLANLSRGGGSQSIDVSFGEIKFKQKGEDLYGTFSAYQSNQRQRRTL